MNRAELKQILLDEFDMQTAYIDATLKQVEEFDDELKAVFFTFLQTKKLPDVAVEEYSCKGLVEKHKFTVIGAFFLLDWIKKDKKAAEAVLMFI